MRGLVFFLSCMLLMSPAFAAEKLGPKAARAAEMARTLILIDIRRPDEWQSTGSAQGAHRISMLRPDFTARVKALQASHPSRKIALICQSGVRSAQLSKHLEEQGLVGIVDVVGGTQLWIAQGLPVTH